MSIINYVFEDSIAVEKCTYNPLTLELSVTTRTPDIYQFYDVKRSDYTDFIQSNNHGKHLRTHLKTNFDYQCNGGKTKSGMNRKLLVNPMGAPNEFFENQLDV